MSPEQSVSEKCEIPVDIVTVDGVHVFLHEAITGRLGGGWSDVAKVVDDAGLVVEEDIRYEGAAVRDVEVAHLLLHPVAGEDGALLQHLVQVSPALVTQAQGSPDTQPQRGAAGRG